jgi:hypothetical protein
VLAAPLAAIALAKAPSCGTAAAKAAVRSSHFTIPASQSISSEAYRVSPGQVDLVICIPLPGGRVAMALTIASGGTAGDIDWAVFLSGAKDYKVSLIRGGYKLGLVRVGSDLVETDPVYKSADPNCCPSGGFNHTRWGWNGEEFSVVRTWHDKSYKP